jgi:hypothetical protein
MSDPLIRKIAEKVLRKEALNGQTTLADASALCMKEAGSEKISKALQILALRSLFQREITHQLKRNLAPNSGIKILPRVPPEIVRRLPQWFSTGDGPGAIWVPSPLATIEQITASRDLRHKKADQTIAQAEFLDTCWLF